MAAKRKNTKSIHSRVLTWVREFDGVSVQEVGEEFKLSDVEANNILVELSNDDLIDVEGGMWVALQTEDYTPGENSAPVEEKSEERKRLEYMASLRDEQDAVFSQASKTLKVQKGSETGDAVKPAKVPVRAQDGSKVTVPVDFEDPSKGRRELDASQGERLIGEDTYTVRTVIPSPSPVVTDKGLAQFLDDETGEMVFESAIMKNGLWLDEPETIPERPAGVNFNTWDLAHTAVTQTARDWHMARAVEQAEEFKINKGQPAPF